MYAYDKMYLDDAMKNLGEAFDCAANSPGIGLDTFMEHFAASRIAEAFGSGAPKYVSGISGTELVCEVMQRSGNDKVAAEGEAVFDCSPEYWCGWILAYYQWHSGRSFKNIGQNLSMDELLSMYCPLHEAPEEKALEIIENRIRSRMESTRLQILRRAAYYSQRTLAEKSGVTLRMIQQYEQRARDINQASASSLLALAQTLGCRMEELLEP